MSNEDKLPKIYTAIIAIMGEMGAVGKSKKNVQQGFMYRGIDDVMNALQPLLAKHHVFVVPTVLEQTREDKQTKAGGNSYLSIFKIKYTFYADDGSFVEAVTVGESADTGDKGSNKAMAIAFKYALFQVFCIPTEEMPDPDADTHELKNKPTAKGEGISPPAPVSNITPPVMSELQKVQIAVAKLLYPNAVGKDKGEPDATMMKLKDEFLMLNHRPTDKLTVLKDSEWPELLEYLKEGDPFEAAEAALKGGAS